MLVATTLATGSAWADDTPPTVDQVRKILRGFEASDMVEERLMKFGVRAFPTYEAIITDPKSNPDHVADLYDIIGRVEGNRKHFLELAVEHLGHQHFGVRRSALTLISKIGSERDTAPVLAMLSDENKDVRRQAALALVKIGGKRDLVAMDIWLKTGNYRDDVHHLNHVKKCRDELEKRLKDAAKEKEKDKK